MIHLQKPRAVRSGGPVIPPLRFQSRTPQEDANVRTIDLSGLLQSVKPHNQPLVTVTTGPDGAFAIDRSRTAPEEDDDTKTIAVPRSKQCAGGCGGNGKWRYATRDFLCYDCRGKPPHQLITRTRAQNEYNLDFQDLHQAFLEKRIRMFTVPNPHSTPQNPAPPSRLYYLHEIVRLARELNRI